MQKIFKFIILLCTVLVFSTTYSNSDLIPKINQSKPILQHKLTGFNINWSFLPPLDNEFIKAVKLLKPEIIRYPGGTVSNFWNWQEGKSEKYRNRTIHKIGDLLKIKKATHAHVTFVLNIISDSFQHQLKLLKKAQKIGIPIKYIEIGNEQYLSGRKFQYNIKKFPTGEDYGKFANIWASKLKKEFPNAKIGIVLLGRTHTKNPRLKKWNNLVINSIESKNYDAFIYHIYLKFPNYLKPTNKNIDKIVNKRISDFYKAMVLNHKKEIWITEYGVHANNAKKTAKITSKLADCIESFANISMAHILYINTRKQKHNFFSMLVKKNKTVKLTSIGRIFRAKLKIH